MPSFKVNAGFLKKLAAVFDDKDVRKKILAISASKAFQAIISQAIADNFAKEGPGWKPLKMSVTKRLADDAARKKGEPHRMILQKTGLLKKSATTPGAQGNIYKVEGTKIIYGTDLVYAGIHQNGGTVNVPATNKGFGIPGLKIKAHRVVIPARPFLKIHDFWEHQLQTFAVEKAFSFIKEKLEALK